MHKNKKVVVVMPAYNAEQTLERTHHEVTDHGLGCLSVATRFRLARMGWMRPPAFLDAAGGGQS